MIYRWKERLTAKAPLHKQDANCSLWLCLLNSAVECVCECVCVCVCLWLAHSGRWGWWFHSGQHPGYRNLWPCTCTDLHLCAWQISVSGDHPDQWRLLPVGGGHAEKELKCCSFCLKQTFMCNHSSKKAMPCTPTHSYTITVARFSS